MTWKALRHPNILPLIGVTMSEVQFAMISDWMVNGNINDFVRAHPDVDRLELVGFSFDVFISSPLMYRITYLAGRRRQGVDLHPQSGDDPRGSQGGAFSTATITPPSYRVYLSRQTY